MVMRSNFAFETVSLTALLVLVAALIPSFISSHRPNPAPSESTAVVSSEPNNLNVTSLISTTLKFILPFLPSPYTLIALLTTPLTLLWKPFAGLLSFVGAVFAPIFIALRLLLHVLFVWPVMMIVGVMKALYPLYVFGGVAVVVGLALGGCAWMVVWGSSWAFRSTFYGSTSKDRLVKKELEEDHYGERRGRKAAVKRHTRGRRREWKRES
ncbi:hypothetical protein SISSUDRAFT_1047064 [Sistotremastrum suecicum HHB10207 ss-3]|uniref:Uncharacterized protein n=1 Tax=Sistotremastrum suecicum HHB10207 ss-3 TaxID=1314776 RepID=A0A166DCZ8_9AGAM|nr:hypothetical protein SISSUDRAFT_1047064 [Sistotremastrum suecicum HHB10207 ss-3]